MSLLFLLVVVPVALWLACECLARCSRAPHLWVIFGFNLDRAPRGADRSPASRGAIRRIPVPPPGRAPHERRPVPLVLDPDDANEPRNGRLEA